VISKGDVDAARGGAEREVGRKRAALGASLARLAPWRGDIAALEQMAPPPPGFAAEMANRIAQAEKALARMRAALHDDQGRLTALELERDQTVRDQRAISPEAVQKARASRDEVWAMLRRQLRGGASESDPTSSVESYEGRVHRADDLSDQRFLAAEQSGRLVALVEDIERLRFSVQAGARKVEGPQAILKSVQKEWREVLASVGLELPPALYAAWTERRTDALQAVLELQAAEARLCDAHEQRSRARKSLLAILVVGRTALDDAPTGVLLELADSLVRAATEAAKARTAMETKAAVNQNAITRAETKLTSAEAALTRHTGRCTVPSIPGVWRAPQNSASATSWAVAGSIATTCSPTISPLSSVTLATSAARGSASRVDR
jgi:hypothetical protein